jgi:signal transduction histidine kinase
MSSQADERAAGGARDRVGLWSSVGLGLAGLGIAAWGRSAKWGLLGASLCGASLLSLGLLAERRRRAHDELQEQHARMQAEQRAFVRTISHDLRTPLTAVLGFSELLTEGNGSLTPERAQTYLRMVKEQSEQLARMLEDAVDLARIIDGVLTLRPEQQEAGDLIAESFLLFPSPAARARVTIVVAPDTPPVWCDKHECEQILDRLVQAALAQTSPAGPVTVEAAPEGQAVRFTVRAPGLTLAHPSFGPFAGELTEALALGRRERACMWSAAARGLVELHHGRVWVEPEPTAGGPAVCFVLPAASEAAAALPPPAGALPFSAAAEV